MILFMESKGEIIGKVIEIVRFYCDQFIIKDEKRINHEKMEIIF